MVTTCDDVVVNGLPLQHFNYIYEPVPEWPDPPGKLVSLGPSSSPRTRSSYLFSLHSTPLCHTQAFSFQFRPTLDILLTYTMRRLTPSVQRMHVLSFILPPSYLEIQEIHH